MSRIGSTAARLVGAGPGVAVLSVGCTEVGPTETPPVGDISNRTTVGPRTANDLLSDLAEQVPGGFGGMFIGGDRKLHVWIKDISKAAQARSALAALGAGTTRSSLVSDVVVEVGRFDWRELHAWYQSMRDQVWRSPAVIGTDMDERENRIRIDLNDMSAATALKPKILALGIPESAFSFERRERATPLTGSLTDRVRPVPGGYKIQIESQGACTLGVNVKHGLQGDAFGFITAGHCTRGWGSDNDDIGYQDVNGSGNRLGVELADPPFFTGGRCPVSRVCRWGDAAIIAYDNVNDARQGFIARTFLNSISIDPTHPEWEIVDDDNGCFANVLSCSMPGDIVFKVGQVTGMTTGQITDTCYDEGLKGPPANGVLLCQDTVVRTSPTVQISKHGDSGSPVFRKTGTSSAVLYGILWGGDDVNFSFFRYSRFNLVRDELDDFVGGFNALPSAMMQ